MQFKFLTVQNRLKNFDDMDIYMDEICNMHKFKGFEKSESAEVKILNKIEKFLYDPLSVQLEYCLINNYVNMEPSN